jgi:hypothetical protein
VLQFPEVFWDSSVDFFGAAIDGGPAARGRCFMFWNLHRFSGVPILTSLVSGAAAVEVGLSASHLLLVNPCAGWVGGHACGGAFHVLAGLPRGKRRRGHCLGNLVLSSRNFIGGPCILPLYLAGTLLAARSSLGHFGPQRSGLSMGKNRNSAAAMHRRNAPFHGGTLQRSHVFLLVLLKHQIGMTDPL